jgi:proteasome accessory factor B
MPKFKPQYRRLLFIDKKLKEKSYPNCTVLAGEWEVSPKTIQRDIEYMKYELEAPIEYHPVKHGYYYTEDNFALPAINISESDLFAVFIAERALSQFRNTPVYGKLRSVFAKIQNSLPDKTNINPSWIQERILCFQEPITTIDVKIWDTIAKAIRDNNRLKIRYTGPGRKDFTERKVDPYYLVNHKGEWYLSTYCHTRNSIRTFAVSRIKTAEALPEKFTLPPGMDKQKMFGDQLGIIWKKDSHKIKIRFNSEVAPYIRERQWHPEQKIRDLRDGGLVLEFTTNHLNEVKDWILSWGDRARVLSPPELIDKVRKSLKQAIASYRK